MIDAVLILDKPAGMTSHDVVNRVRRITRERSVGHLGTLDPMATGVLPLVLGRYTRLAQFFKEGVKIYEGTIRFGFATNTYDAEGEQVGETVAATPTLAELEQHLPSLGGTILQMPPAYSAKKINGVAAYKLARQDKPVELKPVEVEVRRFEITGIEGDRARFVAEVSAGTYIRSLAHDLGQKLGTGAHLAELRRTQAGEFTLAEAVTLEGLASHFASDTSKPSAPSSNLSEYALSDVRPGGQQVEVVENLNPNPAKESRIILNSAPMPFTYQTPPWLTARNILPYMPALMVSDQDAAFIRNGRNVRLPEFGDATLIRAFHDGELVAICERIAGPTFRPKVVLPI